MREKSGHFVGKIRLAHCSLLGIPMKMTNISSYSLLRWRHRRLQMPHLQSHRPSCSHSPLATCTIGFWSTCMRKAEANKLLLSANMSLFVQVEASAICKHVSICSSWQTETWQACGGHRHLMDILIRLKVSKLGAAEERICIDFVTCVPNSQSFLAKTW